MDIKKSLKEKLKALKLNPKGKELAKKVFGFEKSDPKRFLKSPELDEVEVSVTLAKIETDINWIKRLLWLIIGGGTGAGVYFS